MPHRIAPEVALDLDEIAIGIAECGGSFAAAARIVSSIGQRFLLVARYPHLGRSREHDLGSGRRSHSVGDYIIIYRVNDGEVLILRVIHGRRDIETMLS